MTKDSLIGQTFRSTVADGNPLWKVVSKSGPDAYLCEVVNEPYEINGKTYDGEFSGLQDVFLTENIKRNIQWQKNWNKRIEEGTTSTARFYASLKANDIVHYHDGFAKFVRCVVRADKQLVPMGFVGNWQDYDILPTRRPDGTVRKPYWLERRDNSEPFQPNASNIWEAMDQKEQAYTMRSCRPPTPQQTVNFARYEQPFDPTKEPMLSTALPDPIPEELRIADLQLKVGQALAYLEGVHNDPDATENDVFTAMGKAIGALL